MLPIPGSNLLISEHIERPLNRVSESHLFAFGSFAFSHRHNKRDVSPSLMPQPFQSRESTEQPYNWLPQ
jgi:hypothetical protein